MSATPLIPDLNITRRVGTWGDIIIIQVLDDFGNVIDLTTSSSVSIKIQHETITTDNFTRTASIQGAGVNGTIYYVVAKNIDFQNPGKYYISSIVDYPAGLGYPDGKNIISYASSPNWVINNA